MRVGVDLNINRFGNSGGRKDTCMSVSRVTEATKTCTSRFLFHYEYVEGFNFLACVRFIFTNLRF
jgi:hypothetical protein